MKKVNWIMAMFVLLSIVGCNSFYTIKVIDGLPQEVYLKFDKGADVQVGDVFVLYRVVLPSVGASSHAAHRPGSSLTRKQPIGKVKVIKIADETHAFVTILSGTAEDGVIAEKSQ